MRYIAFGLSLASSQSIPRLSNTPSFSSAAEADVRIELDARPTWFSSSHPARVRYASPHRDASGHSMLTLSEFENGWLRLLFADGSDFLIDPAGRQVWCDRPAALTLDDFSAYLLGPVMGFVLRLHGRVCLHASAMAVRGSAFAIVGPSGAGKSTTAAAFALAGWPILSDDIVPVSDGSEGFVAHPGYPRLRLSPESLTAIDNLSGRSATAATWDDDRRYYLDYVERGYVFQATPLPLAAVYVLQQRDAQREAPAISACSGSDALMTLVAHSFASTLFDRDMRARDLTTLSRLVDAVPVRVISRADDLERLPAVVDAILADLESLPRTRHLAGCTE
jgi:hypothetical protein